MARTTFSGPVRSNNGFEGDMLSGTISASSGNITNLVTTTLTIGTAKVTLGSAVSGTVSSNLGYLQVMVGANTRYIGLFQSITL
jgi:hypothetical protein